jgi:choline dehydrogenase-like flavoprotein
MPDIRLGGSVFQPGFFAMNLAEDWERRARFWASRRHVGIYYVMVRGQATGQINALPFANEPLVRYNPNLNDWQRLQQGLLYLTQILFAAGAKLIIPSIYGHAGWKNMDEVRAEFANPLHQTAVNLMTIHLFSSLAMGEVDEVCATDSFGRLRGFSNIWVADASLIPEAPGVNPQLTIMAQTLRTAEYFLNQSSFETLRKTLAEH